MTVLSGIGKVGRPACDSGLWTTRLLLECWNVPVAKVFLACLFTTLRKASGACQKAEHDLCGTGGKRLAPAWSPQNPLHSAFHLVTHEQKTYLCPYSSDRAPELAGKGWKLQH